MAKNMVMDKGTKLSLVCTDPAVPKSGDPVLIGQIPAVATTNERADGTTSVDTEGIWMLSVKGANGGGNAAIAAGDLIYYVTADTPKLSAKPSGVRYGYALDPVASGATTTIRVKVGY